MKLGVTSSMAGDGNKTNLLLLSLILLIPIAIVGAGIYLKNNQVSRAAERNTIVPTSSNANCSPKIVHPKNYVVTTPTTVLGVHSVTPYSEINDIPGTMEKPGYKETVNMLKVTFELANMTSTSIQYSKLDLAEMQQMSKVEIDNRPAILVTEVPTDTSPSRTTGMLSPHEKLSFTFNVPDGNAVVFGLGYQRGGCPISGWQLKP